MGQLFSRALRRLTQCNSGQSQAQQQPPHTESSKTSERRQRTKDTEDDKKSAVQTIPVGQSIDSADYAAFEASKKATTKSNEPDSRGATKEKDKENIESQLNVSKTSRNPPSKDTENAPQVEEAVIKIQALVRGHLTRKALKDAQQQNAIPSLNTLGQSQFDEESLTRNPKTEPQASGKMTPKLESIAEESAQNSMNLEKRDSSILEDLDESSTGPNLKLSAFRKGELRNSVSPVPSEANASIDLNCDTPASVSIDILDHNIQPTDKLASVLHLRTSSPPAELDHSSPPSAGPIVIEPSASNETQAQALKQEEEQERKQEQEQKKEQQQQQQQQQQTNQQPSSVANGHEGARSLDTAEAAAIRIQSAFRGYHTRKHSPYRRRSPDSAPPLASSNNQPNSLTPPFENGSVFPQQQAVQLEEANHSGNTSANLQVSAGTAGAESGPRQSRQRQRSVELASGETPTDTTETGTGTGTEAQIQATNNGTSTTPLDHRLELKSIGNDGPTSAADQDLAQLAPSADYRLSSIEDTTTVSAPQSFNIEGALDDLLQTNESQQQLPRASLEANSMDIESEWSNLGAALSLDDQVSESFVEEQADRKRSDASEAQSIGANLIVDSQDEPTSQDLAQRVVVEEGQEEALERATEALEAALEETVDDGKNDVPEEAAPKEQEEEEEQRATIELESDDIERRDPSGEASNEERAKSPPINVESSSQPTEVIEQPQECVSNEVDAGQLGDLQDNNNEHRSAIDSPDEAFASGPCSPALASSHGSSSSDEGAQTDPEQAEVPQPKEQQQEADTERQGPSEQANSNSTNNKNRKRNRNKKKGKK